MADSVVPTVLDATDAPAAPATAPVPKSFGIVSFLKRKPGLTPEQFYHHWVHVHGPLVRPWAIKHGFLEYQQLHLKSALNGPRPAVGPEAVAAGAAHTALDAWDGCAVFALADLAAFEAAFQDPYYTEVIALDEAAFVDRAAGVMRRRGELNRIL